VVRRWYQYRSTSTPLWTLKDYSGLLQKGRPSSFDSSWKPFKAEPFSPHTILSHSIGTHYLTPLLWGGFDVFFGYFV